MAALPRAHRLVGLPGGQAAVLSRLIAEESGGHPPRRACSTMHDHRVKKPLFALLGTADVGMDDTDSYAMTPAASVSGFASRESTYFSVGKIDDAQVHGHGPAQRVPWPRWSALAPNLGL